MNGARARQLRQWVKRLLARTPGKVLTKRAWRQLKRDYTAGRPPRERHPARTVRDTPTELVGLVPHLKPTPGHTWQPRTVWTRTAPRRRYGGVNRAERRAEKGRIARAATVLRMHEREVAERG